MSLISTLNALKNALKFFYILCVHQKITSEKRLSSLALLSHFQSHGHASPEHEAMLAFSVPKIHLR
jgi:hypothetical protein